MYSVLPTLLSYYCSHCMDRVSFSCYQIHRQKTPSVAWAGLKVLHGRGSKCCIRGWRAELGRGGGVSYKALLW